MKFLETLKKSLGTSHNQQQELLKSIETKISNYGNPYPIKFYYRPAGYPQAPCHACHKTATWRLEVYNHLQEPQGSEYWCNTHVPEAKPEYHD